ncbi:MAG: paraslipin, partial [Phormidesmis sp. CAN_BIN44]|nr:paraslipin [Phormidesmis sp. CAN_BIN44]
TEATVQSIEELARALQAQPNAQEVLRYLVAKDYVNANLEIGKSDNSKIVFMDPRAMNEAITDLIRPNEFEQGTSNSSEGNTTN